MKLTTRTKEVLDRFSKMDGYFKFEAGSTQGMVNLQKTVLIEAEIDQKIPKKFGPVQIKDFVKLLDTFESPEVEFQQSRLVITEGATELVMNSESYPEFKSFDRLVFPFNGMELRLDKVVVDQIKKLKRTMSRYIVEIIGDGEAVYLRTINAWRVEYGNELVTKLGSTKRVFSLAFRLTDIDLVSDNYTLYLSDRNILKMCAESSKLTYYIALEVMDYFDQEES